MPAKKNKDLIDQIVEGVGGIFQPITPKGPGTINKNAQSQMPDREEQPPAKPAPKKRKR